MSSSAFRGDLLLANVTTAMSIDVGDADSILVRDGRIREVGAFRDVARTAPAGTDVLDCGESTLVPGFVDGHCHFEMACNTEDAWISAHTPPFQSLAEIDQYLRAAAADHGSGSGWILCRSSFSMHEKVREGRLFTRVELDRISPDRPLAVFASLHVASMNTVALKALGLWEPGASHPELGVVHRDEHQVPTGVVTEAFLLVPPPGTPDRFRRIVVDKARLDWNARGITTVYTMPETAEQAEVELALHATRDLSLRQRHYFILSPGDSLDRIAEIGAAYPNDDMVAFGGVKVFVNGCAHDGYGHELDDVKWTQQELDDLVRQAHLSGLQLWMHSLNAAGVRMAGRAVEEALKVRPRAHRHRVEHGGDYLDLADAKWLNALGVRLVTTPQFLHSTAGGLGEKHAPWRSLIDLGFELIGGTDTTGTVPGSNSVLGNMATAVMRKNSQGKVIGSGERATGAEALRMFTEWAAAGGFEDETKGKIEPGYLGDVVLLDGDPTDPDTDMTAIEVKATVLGGEVVYKQD